MIGGRRFGWGRFGRADAGDAALRDQPPRTPPHPGAGRDLTDVQALDNLDDLLAHRSERVADVTARLQAAADLDAAPALAGEPYAPLLAGLADWTARTWPTWRRAPQEAVDGFLADLALLLGELVLVRRPEAAWTVNLYPEGTSGSDDERAPAVRVPPVGEQRYPNLLAADALVRSRFRSALQGTGWLPDDWRRVVDTFVTGGAEEFWVLSPLTPNRQLPAVEPDPDDLDEGADEEDDGPDDWRRPGLPEQRATLLLRHDAAHAQGFDGSPARSRSLLAGVLADQDRLLGAGHPDTLVTRYNLAFWRWRAGERPAALAELVALEPELEAGLGASGPVPRAARLQLSRWHAALGAPQEAVAVLERAAAVPGLDAVHRLTLRHDLAHWTGVAGDRAAAARLAGEVRSELADLVGEKHFYTQNAGWTAELWARDT